MSIFAGLAQGFAQGAMAAMPAATDRYVQARRRAKEREQTIEDRQKARAQNLEDERRREMVGLKTTFAKLGGRDLGKNATPEMYRNEIAAYTIDDEYNSKRSQLQQSGIDPTNMDHNQIDQAIANLGVTTAERLATEDEIRKSNLEVSRRQQLVGHKQYMHLEQNGYATEDMLERDDTGKVIGYNQTLLNEGSERQRQDKLAQSNQARMSRDEPYSIVAKTDQINRIKSLVDHAGFDGGFAEVLKVSLDTYMGNPTATTWNALERSYGRWFQGRDKDPQMGTPIGKPYGQIASDKLAMRQAMGGDVLQGFPLLSYGLKPSTGGGVQSTVAETQTTIPIGESKPNTTDSITPFPVSADTLTTQEELELIERAENGDEEAIRRLGL